MFRTRPGRLLNALSMFNLRLVPTGKFNMISAGHLPLRAVFCLFYEVDIVLLVAHELN